MTEQITLEEQEQILEEAYSLILDPKHWVHGKWKCPLYETDAKGDILIDDGGNPVQAKTLNGVPMHQYCIEGAVNQATFNVLGEDRALAVGALSYGDGGEGHVDADGRNFQGDEQMKSFPTRALGLDEIAQELYGRERALEWNDSDEDDAHEGVLTILRTGLERVRTRLGRKVA